MKKKKRGRRPLAQRADRHDLYQRAVQEPEADIRLIDRIYKRRFGRKPRRLREDFCGTAHLAAAWVEKRDKNRAWGIDLDRATLDWGREHNLSRLSSDQAARIKLIEGDVLDIGCEPVDVTCAFNFSYCVFQTRAELARYFRQARSTLRSEGLFFLDLYGGPEAHQRQEEERDVDDFVYIWDQHRFDPISHRVTNFIHFEFRDGSRLKRAFRYDWRLWTIPEIRELLLEAGFAKAEVYWEGTDAKTGEGNDVYTLRETAPDDPAWVSYIVGVM